MAVTSNSRVRVAGSLPQDVLGLDLHPRGLGRQLLALLVLGLVGAGDAGQQGGLLECLVGLVSSWERLLLTPFSTAMIWLSFGTVGTYQRQLQRIHGLLLPNLRGEERQRHSR